MKSLSTLQKATLADVRHSPFPYIVVKDALPSDLYNDLVARFPGEDALAIDRSKNNHRWDVLAKNVAVHKAIDPLWKDFIAYHTSPDFFHEIVDLFYDDIRKLYAKQFPSLEFTKAMRVGTRRKDTFINKDILMDAMISGNTPVRSASSVRTTHIDRGRKVFSGLFYMRRDDDDSVGGDLTISRFRPEYRDIKAKSKLFKGDYVDDEFIDLVETVKYQKNTVVIFINSIDSLHGVTVRQRTSHSRYFVNLVGVTVTRLYGARGGHPYYTGLAWPMDWIVPPPSVVGERLWAARSKSGGG